MEASTIAGWRRDKEIPVLWRKKLNSDLVIMAQLSQPKESKRIGCLVISPLFTLTLPFLFPFFVPESFISYSLGTLQSNKPPSFSPVLDLEPKLETAWLEQRGGSQKRGRCGYWTEQIAPLQSAFYPKTPRLKYPHPFPSNHGSACFPLIIYLVSRWCFLP